MKKEFIKYRILFVTILVVLTAILIFLLNKSITENKTAIEKIVLEQARASFNKDLLYRRWASKSGGVYVPLIDSSLPNPFLKVKNREIMSTAGKIYTLINPAYMTRQVHELGKEQYQTRGHITSLKPINPVNKPDEWERAALNLFETGIKEYSSYDTINGREYMRFIGAMVTEKSCLKCHEQQGYKEGEIRGGISISVPMKNFNEINESEVKSHIITFLVILIIIIVLLVLAYMVLAHEVKKRINIQQKRLESAESHKRIIQSAINGLLIINKNGIIEEVNSSYCSMSGYSEAELLNMKISDLEVVENEENIKNHIDEILEQGTNRFETIHKRKDGSMYNIEVNSLIEPFNNERIVSFIEDISERKNAENILKESEKQLQLIFDSSPSIMLLLNEDTQILKLNRAGLNFINAQLSDEVNKKQAGEAFRCIHVVNNENGCGDAPECQTCTIRNTVLDTITNHKANYKVDAVLKTIKDNQTLTSKIRVSSIPATASPEKTFLLIIDDLTTQKFNEEQLRSSEIKMESIFRAAPTGIGMEINRILTEVNPKLCELTGYSKEELLGQSSLILYLSEVEYENVGKEKDKQINEKGTVTVETIWKKKNGEILYIVLSSTPLDVNNLLKGVTFTALDITERKYMEKDLRDRNIFIQTVLDNLPIGVALNKFEGGRVTYINNKFSEIYGWPVEELDDVEQFFEKVYPDNNYRKKIVEQVMADINSGIPEKMHWEDIIVTQKNGNTRIINAANIPLFEQNTMVSTVIDMTPQKLAEKELEKHRTKLEIMVRERTDELERANEKLIKSNDELNKQKLALENAVRMLHKTQNQLIQSEKLASLGILVAGVAHEINNPVNFINSSLAGLKNNLEYLSDYTELYRNINENTDEILKQIKEKEKEANVGEVINMLRRSIEIIEIGVERTTKIVKGLKAFARSDEKKISKYDLHENIDNTLLILFNQYKNRIQIEKEYGNIPQIECFPGQINQVFMNLLTNAIQAIDGEGKIIIHTTLINENQVSIKITDTGSGIPEHEMNQIFDPFYTTKEIGKGTGLGLSISYGIIKDHHGEIRVGSVLGKGSSFTILLPIHQK